MSWFWEKFDAFMAAAVIAVAGVIGSQGQAFTTQYLERAAVQLAAAEAHLADVQNGLRYRVMGEIARNDLETEARNSVAALHKARDAVARGNVVTRPVALLTVAPKALRGAALRDFTPTLPADVDSIIYAVVGMLVGFVLYETIKLPFVALLAEPRRRRFRRRGPS